MITLYSNKRSLKVVYLPTVEPAFVKTPSGKQVNINIIMCVITISFCERTLCFWCCVCS